LGKKQKWQRIPAFDVDALAMSDGVIAPVTLPDGRPGVELTLTSEVMRGKTHSGEYDRSISSILAVARCWRTS
jgi:hypothetical protein